MCIRDSRQTDKQTDRQTDRQTNKQTDKQTNKQTERQTDKQTDKETDRQTEACLLYTSDAADDSLRVDLGTYFRMVVSRLSHKL